jgi:hypothetical protein
MSFLTVGCCHQISETTNYSSVTSKHREIEENLKQKPPMFLVKRENLNNEISRSTTGR